MKYVKIAVKLFISRWIDVAIAAALSIFPHTIRIGENGIIPLAAMILTLLNILEGVLILRNSSRKFKTVDGNAILRNIDVSPENISESIKIKTENGFYLKVNVCKFQ